MSKPDMNRREFIEYAALAGAATCALALSGCVADRAEVTDSARSNDGLQSNESNDDANQASTDPSIVFFSPTVSPESLMAVYEALGRELGGKVAVKVSTGEPGGHNFLDPSLIADLVSEVQGTIVECNTAYSGPRANTESHLKAAADHGFTDIAEVEIMDADGDVALPVPSGTHLTENYVGKGLLDYDAVINLAHFKGHAMAGFGGVIKNSSIGIASSRGKSWIHSAGTKMSGFGGASQDAFLESMGEAAKSVADHFGDDIVYIDVMNNLSVDCDCDSHPADPEIEDIGILGSLDPVALDRACVDLIYAAEGSESLRERMESRNGLHALEYAEAIGLGTQRYELVELG